MSDHEDETEDGPQEQGGSAGADDLLSEQEGKGYGEDEGERSEALEEQRLRAPSQRRALGALFLVLACSFAGIAVAAGWGAGSEARRWLVVVAAGALAIWLASLALRALRP